MNSMTASSIFDGFHDNGMSQRYPPYASLSSFPANTSSHHGYASRAPQYSRSSQSYDWSASALQPGHGVSMRAGLHPFAGGFFPIVDPINRDENIFGGGWEEDANAVKYVCTGVNWWRHEEESGARCSNS